MQNPENTVTLTISEYRAFIEKDVKCEMLLVHLKKMVFESLKEDTWTYQIEQLKKDEASVLLASATEPLIERFMSSYAIASTRTRTYAVFSTDQIKEFAGEYLRGEIHNRLEKLMRKEYEDAQKTE